MKNKLNAIEGLQIKSINTNIFSRSIHFNNLEAVNFSVDSGSTLNGSIQSIDIKNIKIFKYIFNKKISVGAFRIKGGDIYFDSRKSGKTDNTKKKSSGNNKMNEIEIDNISVSESEFRFDDSTNHSFFIALKDFNVGNMSIKNLQDSATFNFSSVDMSADTIIYSDSTAMYTYRIDDFNAEYKSGSISIGKFSLIPHYDDDEFARLAKYQTDRFDGTFYKIKCDIPSPDEIISETLYRGSITIDSFNLDVYRNKNIPRKKNQFKKAVQQYLADIKLPVQIDSVQIRNGNVKYREKETDSPETGQVIFRNIAGVITGVSNVNKNDTLKVRANCVFMESASLNTEMDFPNNKTYFYSRGNISELPMTQLNIITGPNAGIIFNEGYIHNLAFNMRAALDSSRGDLIIKYDNLDLSVLNKPGGEKKGLKSKLLTLLSGSFLVPHSNPEPGEGVRLGTIKYERHPERFIFNYIWKSIFTGIKTTLIPQKEQKKKKKS